MTLPSNARSRLLGMALLVAVFVAGGLAGAAFRHTLLAREATAAPAPAAPCTAERKHGGMKALLDSLGLSPAQRTEVDAIMDRNRREMDAFWNDEGTRLRAIVDSARADIRGVLTPRQRAEYDRRREESRARRKAEEAARDSAAAAR